MTPSYTNTARNSGPRKRVVVLGSTGSIGVSTLDVLDRLRDHFEVVGLLAGSQASLLHEQALAHSPRWIALREPPSAELTRLGIPCLQADSDELLHRLRDPEVDVVVSAVVGAAGLLGTWAALEAGKTVALANKESLVVAGPLVMDLASKHGGRVIPVDSEHSAVFQAIADRPSHVDRIVLTGSGGPFRGWNAEQLARATVEQALNHPTWKMGNKITVDSATLMNKALEIIEARWLFDLPPERLDVVIHPESMVHSFVEFIDGSVLAQISPPDMRLPIQYALTYPERVPCPARKVDWASLRQFRFEPPDRELFPALDLGFEVARKGGTSGAVLNAANEEVVARFLAHQVPFLNIARACRAILDSHTFDPNPTLDGLRAADRWAREEVRRWISLNP